MFHPFFVALVVAASVTCGTAVESSAGGYGYGPGPAPFENVSISNGVITVDSALGDRQFTTILSRYDAKDMTLLSADMHASCCGSSWSASVRRGADGTYDVETEGSTFADDVIKTSRPHLHIDSQIPVVIGGLFFAPFLQHATHASRLARIDLDSAQVRYLTIEPAPAVAVPSGVPNVDRVELTRDGDVTTVMWFNPCTFTLDAFGTLDGVSVVRRALID